MAHCSTYGAPAGEEAPTPVSFGTSYPPAGRGCGSPAPAKWLAVFVGSPGKYWVEGIQLADGSRHKLLSAQPNYIGDVAWLSESELVYALADNGSDRSGNLWTVKLDPQTGLPFGPARQRTHWVGFEVRALSSSADGKHLCFNIVRRNRLNVWLGDIDTNGTKITRMRQLTFEDALEYPYAWTPDSKAVVFRSDRDGHERMYKQAADGNGAE